MLDRSPLEVLLTFLKLGTLSFGGPIAHLGYFREEIVVRRRWVDDPAYTDLVALCQFLPGPASSQVGFALGLMRAGFWGGFAAWVGFTFPSAVLMTAIAFGAGAIQGRTGMGVMHGLTLVALAVVAQAVWGMARTLCPDRQRAAIACCAAIIILLGSLPSVQLSVILGGGLAGLLFCRDSNRPGTNRLPLAVTVVVPRWAGATALAAFFVLFWALSGLARLSPTLAHVSAFYRAGALVFGGGHVVLPLLSNAFVAPGWLSEETFLVGYGAAQAMPGPLFTIAAYIGAVVGRPGSAVVGATLGVAAIFMPGMLLLVGVLPFWSQLRQRVEARAVMRGINAAVVGLLGAALYSPLWTSAVRSLADIGIVLAGFGLLTWWRAPPLLVVSLGAIAGVALTAPPT